MEELVYENSTFSGNNRSTDFEDGENSYEEIYMNEVNESKKGTTTSASETITSGHGCYRLAVVCLLMLVVPLLAVIVILWINFNNLTIERDQFKKVAEERDKFQRKRDELQNTLSQLKKDINTPGWKYFSSSIYYISPEKKSWSESREDCRRRGADLVIIKSREEQDLVDLWRKGESAWIGANDRDTEEAWKWVDGTAVTNGFWNRGEPNNIGDEDCAVSGYKPDFESDWVDVSCNKQYIWICEKIINS